MLVDASVVGRVFWRGALCEIDDRPDLSQLLGSLEARDLVQREAVSRIKGDQQFGFKHGLIHDVAYGRSREPRVGPGTPRSLASSRRRRTSGQSHEALGHHWRAAGENERAVEHLTAAADQAGRGWAKPRAVTLYREALELLGDDDAAPARDHSEARRRTPGRVSTCSTDVMLPSPQRGRRAA